MKGLERIEDNKEAKKIMYILSYLNQALLIFGIAQSPAMDCFPYKIEIVVYVHRF